MGLVEVALPYAFKNELYGKGRDSINVTDKNFKYIIKFSEKSKDAKLSILELKNKYYKKALSEAAYKQLSDLSDYINK